MSVNRNFVYIQQDAERLTEILSGADPAEVAYELADAEYPVVPVNGVNRRGRPEKAPKGRFTSTSPAFDPTEAQRATLGGGVGIAPNRSSGLVIIDADTDAEVQALATWWREVTGEDLPERTVKTPGVKEGDEWKHSLGGHWYVHMEQDWGMDAEEGTRFKSAANIVVGDDHFSIISEGRYAVCPPTERTEGPYELVGEVIPADDTLAEAIQAALTIKKRKPVTREVNAMASGLTGNTAFERIGAWKAQTSWDTIVTAAGFEIIGTECSGDCLSLHWPNSTTQRSGIAHNCDTMPPILFLPSSTAQVDLGLKETSDKWDLWLAVHKGNKKAAYDAAGINDSDYGERSSYRASKAVRPKPTPKAVSEPVSVQNGSQGVVTAPIEDDEDDEFDENQTRFQQALAYAQKTWTCEETEAGQLIWGRIGGATGGFEEGPIADDIAVRTSPGTPVGNTLVQQVLATMRSDARIATFDGAPRIQTDPRVVSKSGETYLYTGDRSGEVVRISGGGVTVSEVPEGARFTPQLGIPMEVDLTATPEDARKLMGHINVPQQDEALILAWLVSRWVSPDAPLPVLIMSGLPGTGKTSTASRLKTIVDDWGGDANIGSLPRDEAHASTVLAAGAALLFDNFTSVRQETSDLLCRVSTGGATMTRKLYTDSELVVSKLRRGVIMTCVDVPSLRADLRSRSVFIQPEIIKTRATTSQMDAAWERDVATIRGGLAALASAVMKRIEVGEYRSSHRLADFEVILMAVGDILGIEGVEGTLVEAQKRLASASYPDTIEFLRENPRRWSGKLASVFATMRAEAREVEWATTTWPSSARGFSVQWREHMEALSEVYTVVEGRDNKGKTSWDLIPIDSEGNSSMDSSMVEDIA